ncbi:MBL fold metallo-hydrolase [Gramella aestuarii]|uniref:MBL fold metallo-hydrolase n=2 Tax=Christiangramia aestuarii TaxID=1028746 RepID=A0A7K1LS15_9FLAO|nr:MBL fold metallo-hydrolase [Christiangramia aestuarii]MUP43583.1 MBL fold metallo-hydrolase [Christiangramia aestuarii]
MKRLITLVAVVLIFTACKNEKKSGENAEPQLAENTKEEINKSEATNIEIIPISHATAVVKWGDAVFYLDPIGGAEAFKSQKKPDFILVTDIHGDHMNAETLMAVQTDKSKIIVPKAVQEELPEELQDKLVVMNNGETLQHSGFNIRAIPMYNLPQSNDAMHVKGRGNGYVLEKNGERLYIAGDTEDIPEMRKLENIDVALIPMNLPYTMPVERAAEGVLAFKPKKVIPYHYRGKNGLADVEKFKSLVNGGDNSIEVQLMDWYPEK